MIEHIGQYLVNAVLLGCLYLMFAVGINLIFGVMKVVNFAHGDLIMLGTYAGFWVFTIFAINPLLSAPIVFLIAFVGGFFIFKYLINSLLGKPGSDMSVLMITFGLSILLQNIAQFLWTANYRGIPIHLPIINFLGIFIPTSRLIIAIVATSATIALYFFLKKTTTGKAIRAISQNREVAPLLGINVARLNACAFGIGTALACTAGLLISIIYSIWPFMGMPFIVISFCVMIIGGMGSFKGLFMGAFTLAIIEIFVGLTFGVEWKTFAFFITIILLVLLRPTGIAGVKIR